MKFYDCSTAPSPRRVRIFLAEKGLDIPTVQIDLRGGEHLGEAFRKLNPHCTVPVLELDDGTTLWDSNAICLYLDEANPEPNLLGRDAQEKAVVATWNRIMEIDGLHGVRDVLRNTAKGMANRALTGPVNYAQIPEVAERGRARIAHYFEVMNEQLGKSEFVAGDRFTVADITGLVAVDFAGWVKAAIPEDAPNLKRWHDAVSARPGAVS